MFIDETINCRGKSRTGGDIWLTPPDDIGLPCIVKMVNNPLLSEHFTQPAPEQPYTQASYSDLLELERTDPSRRYWWIWHDSLLAGLVGLYDIKYDGYVGTQSAKIYCLVRQDMQRNGIARAVVERVIRYSFDTLQLGAVGVDIFADHEAGRAFTEAVGFKVRFSSPKKYPDRASRIVCHGYIMNPKVTPDED